MKITTRSAELLGEDVTEEPTKFEKWLSKKLGKSAGDIAFYAYVVPFLVSTVGGSVIAGILVMALGKTGALKTIQGSLER